MSLPWKVLPIAAIVAALGALLLAPGGAARPDIASADFECGAGEKMPLQVRILDIDDGLNPIEVAGATVRIAPDPTDGTSASRNYIDNGTNDDSNTIGTVRENEACTTSGASQYTVTLLSLPNTADCDIVIGSSGNPVTSGHTSASTIIELYVGNCEYNLTPTTTVTVTGTVTGTPGAAATVTTSASPSSVGCSGTSIVTIQVRDAQGRAVAAGTAVTIASNIGSVSPSSGQTTDASGSAFVFFTAPPAQGGTATITAVSGSAQGSATVTVNCGAAAPTATTAPPPTVAPGGGGVISPPNTGDAGLAAGTSSTSQAFAGLVMLAAIALGAVGVARVRA